jgi:DNA-binding transcriptional LysR family regulator
MLALRAAALAGVGVMQLPTMKVCDQIEAGTLTRVLPLWAPRRARSFMPCSASRRGLMPAVRALVDLLVARFNGLVEDWTPSTGRFRRP